MTTTLEKYRNVVLIGNAIEKLRLLPDGIVQCVVTSPPYWGLRNYNTNPQIWGGDANCEHDWQMSKIHKINYVQGNPEFARPHREKKTFSASGGICAKCGAWRGELGNEPTPQMFVQNLVEIFREVKRVLRDDGVLFLNLGDSYLGGGRGSGYSDKQDSNRGTVDMPKSKILKDIKPKNLIGIPWMVAFALRDDGWYLRNDIIWNKVNCMPESVEDRCTRSHEYIFLMTKKPRYYFDHIAIQEPVAPATVVRAKASNNADARKDGGAADQQGGLTPEQQNKYYVSISDESTRNKRTVWTMATNVSRGNHFATFPDDIPLTGIKAGTSAHGSCAQCGAPWKRIVEKQRGKFRKTNTAKDNPHSQHGGGVGKYRNDEGIKTKTIGWQPTCKCGTETVVPCIVMDPFCGSGTTIDIAKRLGADYIGIELNEKYADTEFIPRMEKIEGMFKQLSIERM